MPHANKRSPLDAYRSKRNFQRTPEPGPDAPTGPAASRFVIQEHHATALHWDFRLEKDGVLVSWAVPKGLPQMRRPNHLAVHTEDHPLSYLDFEGDIPEREYGGGRVILWDRGTFETEKFRDDEVIVVLHGQRVRGKYVLFRTRGDQWMVHRMDPPDDPDREPFPRSLQPMQPTAMRRLPTGADWSFEMSWGGLRALAFIEGGRASVMAAGANNVTAKFPEFIGLGAAMGATEAVFDGELVVLGDDGHPARDALSNRLERATAARARTGMKRTPAVFFAFDLLFAEGHTTTALSLLERRELLGSLLPEGEYWRPSPSYETGGRTLLTAARDTGLAGVTAKRTGSPYRTGETSRDWRFVSAY